MTDWIETKNLQVKYEPYPHLRDDDGRVLAIDYVVSGDAVAADMAVDKLAYIIRAANVMPELYKALENGETLIAGDLTGAEWKLACQQFIAQARAALAKARGETT